MRASSVDTSADNNANSIVIKGKDLDALSDDPDELQDELNALGRAGRRPERRPDLYRWLHRRTAAAEIVHPRNSHQSESILRRNTTNSATDELRFSPSQAPTSCTASMMLSGNDSAFNSLNPFVTSEPPYYSTFMMGNVGGVARQKRLPGLPAYSTATTNRIQSSMQSF